MPDESRVLWHCHRCGSRKQKRNLPMVELLIEDSTFLRVMLCKTCFHMIETMFFPLVLNRIFHKKAKVGPDQTVFPEGKK